MANGALYICAYTHHTLSQAYGSVARVLGEEEGVLRFSTDTKVISCPASQPGRTLRQAEGEGGEGYLIPLKTVDAGIQGPVGTE